MKTTTMLDNEHPSPEDWNNYRSTVAELWSRMTLKKVQHHMQVHHKFSAR